MRRKAQEIWKGTNLVAEESPVGDKNANGAIESMNNVIEGLIRALKDEAAAQAEAEAQGARILSADEEKALFAQAVAQAQESKAKAETGNSNAPASFGLAVPSADQVKSYVSSLAETSTSAVPESEAVRAAAEAQAAKELEISRRSRDAGAEGAKPWWQALGAQALDAGGKIAQASMEAMSEANEKKKSEPVQSPLDPLTSMMKKSSKDSLYKQLDKAIENAGKLGFTDGAALYPMVTMNGEECHNEWEITFEEIHRNAAIAYGVFD